MQGVQRGAAVAVVHQFEPAFAALADAADLIVRQRSVATVHVPNDIGIAFEHDVLIDQAGAGDRGSAGVDRALDAVFPRPGNHFAAGRPVLDAAESDLAEKLHASRGELGEIDFFHSVLDHRGAGMKLHPTGPECRECPS